VPGKSFTQAAVGHKPQTTKTTKARDEKTQPMELAPWKYSSCGNVVTRITTVQQIVTGLKSAETEDERSGVVKMAGYRHVAKE
jgi:peptidyl-tRNA hydrolase